MSGAALDRLATVMRAADTVRHDGTPQAAGPPPVSVGLSRMSRKDQEAQMAGVTLHATFFGQARDSHGGGADRSGGSGA
mgnify:CR=1 FL=1